MEKIEIQNLKCGGCAATIKTKLQNLENVQYVDVNVDEQYVMVNLHSSEDLEIVKRKLTSLGYPPANEPNGFGKKVKSYVSCATGRVGKEQSGIDH